MPIIKNWGFTWSRAYIFRGYGGFPGHLKGKARGKPVTDFKDQIGIYLLQDNNRQIIYVGQVGSGKATLFTRLKQHMDGNLAGRWDYFTWFGFFSANNNGTLSKVANVNAQVANFKYSQALNEMEAILIEVIEPALNKQGGNLKGATEYEQYIDGKIKDVSNAEILQKLKTIERRLDKPGS